MTAYRKTEIARRLGEPPRKVQFWVDEKIVTPDIVPPSGRGKAMLFSERNLIEFGMIQIMKDEFGLGLAAIKNILAELRMISDPDQRTNSSLEFASDFYTNLEWGTELELLYVYQHRDPTSGVLYEAVKSLSYRGQDILSITEPKVISEQIDDQRHLKEVHPPSFEAFLASSLPVTVVGIGKIKNLALERLGIK
jgi:DNA-binding transcriptional MerR regulator